MVAMQLQQPHTQTIPVAGFTYDHVRDEFVAPQPFESWTLDENNDWQPPTPKPDGHYYWNEEFISVGRI
jgi:hypothetical protein